MNAPIPAVPLPMLLLLLCGNVVVLHDFQAIWALTSSAPLWVAYAFPLCLALVLCWRIAGRYARSFAWAATLGNISVLLVSTLDLATALPNTYSVWVSVVLLFWTQALLLWLKQRLHTP